jgi:hypothetical protein
MSWCCCSCPIEVEPPVMHHVQRIAVPTSTTEPLPTARHARVVTHVEFQTAIGNNPQTHPKKRHQKLASTDMMDVSEMLKWDEATYNKYVADRAKLANEQIEKK